MQKEKVYSSSDIFIFPSYFSEECFPLVILEAMNSKLPIVATSIAAIPEIVRNNIDGILVPPKDPKGLFLAIEKLILDSNMRVKMGNSAYSRMNKNFHISFFEIKLRRILLEVATN